MSKTSKLVVTLRVWDVDLTPIEDEDGNLIDYARSNERLHEYKFPRRDYPRGPKGKAELIADLADTFNRNGVSFAATGNDWAAQPDGPYDLYDREGTQREVSVHFETNTPFWVFRDVMNEVG